MRSTSGTMTIPRESALRMAAGALLLAWASAACGGAAVDRGVASPTSQAAETLASTQVSTPEPPRRSSAPTAVPSAAATLPRIDLPVAPGSTVEGLVQVDGHDIYARCAGSGSPTVVYFTGFAPDRTKQALAIAARLERALGPGVRICSYERRNTGRSERVAGTQTPEDLVADADGVLAALGERDPLVLVGASFGGLVALAYAVAHPERVAGIVLLDASTSVEYDLEVAGGMQGACLAFNRETDAWQTLEMIDNCALMQWVHDRRDAEPAVPLRFLASQDPSDRGTPAQDEVRKAWVKRWSPGTWEVVNAPHWMDEAAPFVVADAIRKTIAEGPRSAR